MNVLLLYTKFIIKLVLSTVKVPDDKNSRSSAGSSQRVRVLLLYHGIYHCTLVSRSIYLNNNNNNNKKNNNNNLNTSFLFLVKS